MSLPTGRRLTVLQELFRLKLRSTCDVRVTPMVVEVSPTTDSLQVSGFSLNAHTDAHIRAVAEDVFGGRPLSFSLKNLAKSSPKFAKVTGTAAPFFRSDKIDIPDQLTTALPGAIMRVYFKEGKFSYCQHPDGYVGFVETMHLQSVATEEYLAWKNGPAVVLLRKHEVDGITLPTGTRLCSAKGGRAVLPSGETAALPKGSFRNTDVAAAGLKWVKTIKSTLPQFKGTPYHWGGKAETGIDCSGFVQSMALLAGVNLPRDASMQCAVGEMVGYLPDQADLLPGDVLFFMNDRAYVYHVGVYLGNQEFVHSSRRCGGVVLSTLRRGTKDYVPTYGQDLCYARRIF